MKNIFNNRKWRRFLLVAAGFLVLCGLAGGGWAIYGKTTRTAVDACAVTIPYSSVENANQVTINEEDNGKTIDMTTGQQLILMVKYYPYDGYGWTLKEISNPAVLTKVRTIYNPNDV
jgi:hypothetical protein